MTSEVYPRYTLHIDVSHTDSTRVARVHPLGQAMRKVKEVRVQILDICKQLKMRVSTCGSDWDQVGHRNCCNYCRS